MKRDPKKPLQEIQVEQANGKKQVIGFFANFDMDATGTYKLKGKKNQVGMYINIFKSDFDSLGELQHMYLVRYQEYPELLLKEDYKPYFNKIVNGFRGPMANKVDEEITSQFFLLLSDIIRNVLYLEDEQFDDVYEFLFKIIDTPEGEKYAPYDLEEYQK